jgi:hypothetical protein
MYWLYHGFVAILEIFPSVNLVFITSNPYLNTIPMLPRSMIVVFRITTRTLEAHCQMFLDLLFKHRCMGNIMILSSSLYLNTFELAVLSCISCSAFSLGRIYSQFLCVNTFSFPLDCLNCIGPPRSPSRKMILFVPRPWYRCCRQHN